MRKNIMPAGSFCRQLLLLVAFFGVYNTLNAQSSKNIQLASSLTSDNHPPFDDIQPLDIGDQVPDILFHNVLNYKSKTAKLSDFKGKLVILDMWSTWCTSCIAAFPKMEELQKKFGDKIQILLVNPHDVKYDSEKRINQILEKNKVRTGFYPSLPIPIHDSILNYYFPHKSVPHCVLIDEFGKVAAVTNSKYITEENVQSVFRGQTSEIPVKDDWAFDRKTPLLIDGNGGQDDEFIYRSIFTKYKLGIGTSSGNRTNDQNKVIGIYKLNKSLRMFIGEAYLDLINDIPDSRIVLEVKNPAQYQLKFDSNYTYCYDVSFPPASWEYLYEQNYLKQDLKRVFNVSVYKERRKVKCLVFTATDKIKNISTRHKKTAIELQKNSIKKYIHNYPVDKIFKILGNRFNIPLINESGLNQNIDIEFPDNFDFFDNESILDILKKTGFEIRDDFRELEVVIISDK